MLALITISVLSLFHPTSVILKAERGAVLTVDTRELNTFEFIAKDKEAEVRSSRPITAIIAGKIARAYPSPIRLRPHDGVVEVLIDVDLETAVAWVVAGESSPGARPEALKALAVVARSWYAAARGRHAGFDFCDTTHCQFLGAAQARAASVGTTLGLVILFDGKAIEAMHSADCGGRTKTLAAVGLTADAYPFYEAQCDVPGKAWHRTLTEHEAELLRRSSHSENTRVAICRRTAWDRIPSNEYVQNGLMLEGRGRGHGVGLCQVGAAQMAAKGADLLAILRRYFPNTAIGYAP